MRLVVVARQIRVVVPVAVGLGHILHPGLDHLHVSAFPTGPAQSTQWVDLLWVRVCRLFSRLLMLAILRLFKTDRGGKP